MVLIPLYIPRDFEPPKPPFIDGHPLGTGEMGADIYYGVVWGTRTTIVTSLFVVLTAALIGLVVGAIAGYYGGSIDEILMRFTDIFLALPALILAMAVASILTRSLENMMFALIIVWWPGYARLVRGQVLSIRENTYVEAARAIGGAGDASCSACCPQFHIPAHREHHPGPRCGRPGSRWPKLHRVRSPQRLCGMGKNGLRWTDWFLGTVYYEGQKYTPWWVVTFPAMMILIFTMGFSLIGDGLRDILDPRSRR